MQVVYANQKGPGPRAPLFFVTSCDPATYRGQLLAHFQVQLSTDMLLMRCTACNKLVRQRGSIGRATVCLCLCVAVATV